MALAEAIREGALVELDTLYLYNNQIGSAGVVALVDALCAAGTPSSLVKLYLDNNRVGEEGVARLCEAITDGHLPALRSLQLSGNPAPAALVSDVVQSVERQAAAAGDKVRMRPTPQTRDIEVAPVG
mmetsp:Transcript_19508/g.39842  ORF Transcript_19508/g.39842 Transcript_19508/m.39842 type:complete len:127 (+) Transcript_19508:1003-1383(+)